MWKRGRCGTITPYVDGKLYQIEREAIVNGLRGANVRVEKRLDGSLAVRYGERYLPVRECAADRPKTHHGNQQPPAKPTARRGSDWNKNFDLKKAPKVWQATQHRVPPRRVDAGMSALSAQPTEVARRQSSPYTGKLSARPAGKPGDFFTFWRICDDPFPATSSCRMPPYRGAQYAFFKAWRNLSGPMWSENQNQTLGRSRRLPPVGPGPR